MATKINQKEYLKKYLSNDVGTSDLNKKKKKKKSTKSGKTDKLASASASSKTNVRIIDDDIDISRLRPIDDNDLDQYAIGEEAPQIVGVVDDRPAELIASEDYKQSEKWKVLRNIDGALTVNQLGNDGRVRRSGAVATIDDDREQMARRRFTRYDSDDEDGAGAAVAGGDSSPVRRGPTKTTTDRRAMAANRNDRRSRTPASVSSDQSPVRRGNRSPSPFKQNRSERRAKETKRSDRRSRTPASPASDHSPARRRNRSPRSPKQKRKHRRSRTPEGLPNQSKATASSDQSPVRRRQRSRSPCAVTSPKNHPLRGSPDRSSAGPSHRKQRRSPSPAHRSRRRSGTPDASPPRRQQRSDRERPVAAIKLEPRASDSDQSPVRRQRNADSDASPPRRRRRQPSVTSADASPLRRGQRNKSPSQRRQHRRSRSASPAAIKSEKKTNKSKLSRWSRDRSTEPTPPPPANAKMMRTLDGKAAGLQNAKALRKESDGFRSKEAALFEAMSGSVSGRDAEAVVRDRRTGRVRDVEAEMAVEHEKMRKELERKAVYDRWGKGVKQLEAHQTLRADEQHEASKPLARYADDADRDALLRQRARVDDPMLEYVRSKQSALEAGKPARPVYRGAYPDNRFGLRPGYRWDGVDRSNGFEKRWFEVQSRSKAAEEETYKYMTEDM